MKIFILVLIVGVFSLFCQSCASPSSPENKQQDNAKLIDLGNGICQQNNGLMWQMERSETFTSAQNASAYARNLTLGNHGDWRLPSKDESYELYQLFEMNLGGDCSLKPKGSYWTTNGEIRAGEWEAYPICGGSALKYLKSKSGRVRAVRP